MALSILGCLNHFHPIPTSTSKSSPSQATQLAWPAEKERSWKRRCIIGVACVVLGLQMEILPAGEINLAWGMQQEISHDVSSSSKVQRWSDKRSCPPWRLNSLETIVPENLPRPSARRRWEATGYGGHETAAPQVTETAPNNYPKNCFSL